MLAALARCEKIAAMNAATKQRIVKWLAITSGMTLGTVFTRIDRHQSALDWETFTSIVAANLILFLLHSLWIELRHPDRAAGDGVQG
jgi:hypothetical protein